MSSSVAANDFRLLASRPSPLTTEGFCATQVEWDVVRVLVVGAGGLGCEVLHLLAVSGFTDIAVVDMDTIDVTNLNRQFLFRADDVGKSKAVVAADAVTRRCPGTRIVPVFGRVEDQSDAFYDGFDVIILGLDSVAARQWMNRKVAQLAERRVDPATRLRCIHPDGRVIPIVDGGTEGMKGSVRLIRLGDTPCIECLMYLYPPRRTVPMCTLENIPRSAEHCVLYAQFKLWVDHMEASEGPLDGDNAMHVAWIREQAQQRQRQFGIPGGPIDSAFVLGVVKNVVPAVGFTNALIASQCVLEVVKLLTGMAPSLDCFAFFNGAAEGGGVASYVTRLERDASCSVCGPRPVVTISDGSTPDDVLRLLAAHGHGRELRWGRGGDVDDDPGRSDVSLRLVFPATDAGGCIVYLRYKSTNPLRTPITGRGVGDIVEAHGGADLLAQWRTGKVVPTIECTPPGGDAAVHVWDVLLDGDGGGEGGCSGAGGGR